MKPYFGMIFFSSLTSENIWPSDQSPPPLPRHLAARSDPSKRRSSVLSEWKAKWGGGRGVQDAVALRLTHFRGERGGARFAGREASFSATVFNFLTFSLFLS